MEIGRYAPSTTGRAHPGTLLAALLCWLDARSLGARIVLRLEDLDPERCRPEFLHAMQRDLTWLGLEWDEVVTQSDRSERHDAALEKLARDGLLYACSCSRAQIRASGERSPDGGFRYPGTCRREPQGGDWRASRQALRVRLSDSSIELGDESGEDLSQNPFAAFGDPVVRRRDGATAYHLASVVDDLDSRVTRVVRGRDLATSSATQVAIGELLGATTPSYRHHLLLLEPQGEKLAKLHGSVSIEELTPGYSAEALCGWLAHAAGLRPAPEATTPRELLQDFSWERVRRVDRVVAWNGDTLALRP